MTRGVLLLAYGTPERPEDVADYLRHIRGGRVPSAAAVEELQERYERVGGRTPLLDITRSVASALEAELNASSGAQRERFRVYVGMKHWHPYIADVVPRIAADGVTDLTALALAPHYSRMSIGAYQRAVEEAIACLARPLPVRFVQSWHLHSGFVEFMSARVTAALEQWPARDRPQIVTLFSAHSLPERIRQWGDPYEQQLRDSSAAVAARAGVDNWRFAWQSAGQTDEPWIGPDVCDAIGTLHDQGARHVLSVPIGFVSDHLEIAYDLDHELRNKADSLGVTWRRTPMPNADPAFVRVLSEIVTEHAAQAAMAG